MSTPKVMKQVDRFSNEMRCRVCGSAHWAMQGSRGFLRGSWQCHQGCKLPEGKVPKAFDGLRHQLVEPAEMFIPPRQLAMRA
jgi:hypothetical protein